MNPLDQVIGHGFCTVLTGTSCGERVNVGSVLCVWTASKLNPTAWPSVTLPHIWPTTHILCLFKGWCLMEKKPTVSDALLGLRTSKWISWIWYVLKIFFLCVSWSSFNSIENMRIVFYIISELNLRTLIILHKSSDVFIGTAWNVNWNHVSNCSNERAKKVSLDIKSID